VKTNTVTETVVADTQGQHLEEMEPGAATRDPRREAAERDATYQAAAPLVAAAIERVYPVAHMEVLKRYGVTQERDTFNLVAPERPGDVTQFQFNEDDALLTPKTGNYADGNRVYGVDDATLDAVLAWRRAHEAYTKTRSQLLTAYKAVINTARTLNQVVDVWPEAAQLEVPNRPLVLLSDETLALIRADVAERSATA
jgi:hypothetical protein